MQQVVTPVIHLVITPDWVAIAVAIAGGVVALAGIWATYLQGKRATKAASESLQTSINAETERARMAEKRRIYATCLSAFTEMTPVMIDFRHKYLTGKESEWKPAELRQSKARDAMTDAVILAQLIAPPEITHLLVENREACMDYSMDTYRSVPFDVNDPVSTRMGALRKSLYNAMRADLGEPVEPAEPGGS